MKSYYALLVFGIVMCLFGGAALSAASSSSYNYYSIGSSSGNPLGMLGFSCFIFGILVCIVSAILIERESKQKRE